MRPSFTIVHVHLLTAQKSRSRDVWATLSNLGWPTDADKLFSPNTKTEFLDRLRRIRDSISKDQMDGWWPILSPEVSSINLYPTYRAVLFVRDRVGAMNLTQAGRVANTSQH